MRHLVTSLALATSLLGAPALAQDADAMMEVLSFDALRAIVSELDYSVVEQGVDEDGDAYLEIESDTGLPFYLYGAACEAGEPAEGCTALNAVGTFALAADADIGEVMRSISFAFMKVYRSGADVKISRYVILDGGISRENLKENVRVFAEIGDTIWGDLSDDDVLAN